MKKRKIYTFLVLMCFSVNLLAANYSTVNSSAASFTDSDTWRYSSVPGTFSDNEFSVNSNSTIEINGNVVLNGSLDMTNSSNLILNDNSVLIIEGNLTISDLSEIKVGNNASIYIKGNLITKNKSNQASEWYVLIDMWAYSNFVVEGDLTIENSADLVIYPYEYRDSDIYVFGNTEGNGKIYKTTNGHTANPNIGNLIEDKDDFIENEATLIENIEEIIEEIELQSCTLTIAANKTVTISQNTTICGLDMGDDSKLIIPNGITLTITNDVELTKGMLYNYGTIEMIDENNYKKELSVKTQMYNGHICSFYNAGTIEAENIYFGKGTNWNELANSSYFTNTCAGVLNADTICFYMNQPYFKAQGEMNANFIAIYNTDGYNYSGNLIIDECAEIKTDSLYINGNVNNIKIYGHVVTEILNTNKTVISADDDNGNSGILTIGGSVSNIDFVVDENSTLNLCYNPRKGVSDDFLVIYSTCQITKPVGYRL